jgi:hypothetical protein
MGVDDDGMAVGEFFATGHQPQCLQRIRASGIALPDEMFREQRIAVPVTPLPAELAGVVASGDGEASYLTR